MVTEAGSKGSNMGQTVDGSTAPELPPGFVQSSGLNTSQSSVVTNQAPERQRSHKQYTIGWVCALPKEMTAAIAMLDRRHDDLPSPSNSNDDNCYALGSIGSHNIVIACLPKGKIGTISAASVALNMIRTFSSIKFGLMVGIGGGIPNKGKVRLGDVVVGTPTDQFPGVVQWDIGKATQAGFERTGILNNPPNIILKALGRLEAEHNLNGSMIPEYLNRMVEKFPRLTKYLRSQYLEDILFKSDYGHRNEVSANPDEDMNEEDEDESEEDDEEGVKCKYCDKKEIVKRKTRKRMRVHYGLIASGNRVIKDANFRDKLNKHLGGEVLCVEMEAAGLLHNFPCIVIRGICDYADSHKNRDWQEHAAAVAAAFARELLGYIPASEVDGVDSVKDVVDSVARIEANVEKTNSRLDRQEDFKILEWLTPTNYDNQQADYLSLRQQGTGEWLLNSIEYGNWRSANQQILFCPGIPGAGKTILTSIVVNDLTAQFASSKVGIAYIYCNFRRKEEQNLQNLLASLLKQLATARTLPEAVKKMHDHHQEKRTRPSIDEITSALESVSKDYERVFIIVDALDECQASNNCREIFISKLFQLHSRCDANIFATSRMLPEIMNRFENSRKVGVRAHDEDVRRYLDAQISDSGDKTLKDHREEIKSKITKVVDGMFLLARLHFETIKTKTSLKKMRDALKILPTGEKAYDEAYKDAMTRIKGQNEDFKDLAHQVLGWITRAKRPITTAELQHALGVEIGQPKFDESNCPELGRIVSVCAGLVTIDEQSRIIRLVHYTTQEYFDRAWQVWFSSAEKNIAEACVTYLSYDIFNEGPNTRNKDFNAKLRSKILYNYATNYWAYHTNISLIGDSPLVMAFLEKESMVAACAQALIQSQNYFRSNGSFDGWMGIHLAALTGAYESMRGMIDKGVDLDAEEKGWGRTPLSWAAEKGHEGVVKLLIDSKADLETKDKDGQTPLLWAVRNGHERVVKLLIDSKADLEAKDKYGRTPLLWAARNRHEGVVKLLIDSKADLETKDKYGRTPLSWAAEKGHEGVVKLLIDSKADLETKDKDYDRTPLLWAARNGHEEVVKLLINSKADLDTKDKYGRTALSWAADNGHEGVVKLLIDTKASRSKCGGRTPVNRAAEYGHTAVVERLTEDRTPFSQSEE